MSFKGVKVKFKDLITGNKDKLYHIVANYTMIMTFVLFTNIFVAISLSILISVAKELYDRHSYGLFSYLDLLADGIGIIIGTMIFKLLA